MFLSNGCLGYFWVEGNRASFPSPLRVAMWELGMVLKIRPKRPRVADTVFVEVSALTSPR